MTEHDCLAMPCSCNVSVVETSDATEPERPWQPEHLTSLRRSRLLRRRCHFDMLHIRGAGKSGTTGWSKHPPAAFTPCRARQQTVARTDESSSGASGSLNSRQSLRKPLQRRSSLKINRFLKLRAMSSVLLRLATVALISVSLLRGPVGHHSCSATWRVGFMCSWIYRGYGYEEAARQFFGSARGLGRGRPPPRGWFHPASGGPSTSHRRDPPTKSLHNFHMARASSSSQTCLRTEGFLQAGRFFEGAILGSEWCAG